MPAMTALDRRAAAPQHTFLERMLDGIERAGNKMPDPAILFLVALRRGDRPLAGPLLVRRPGDLRGRQAAARADRADLLRRLDGADRRRADASPMPPEALQGRDRDREGQGPADRRRRPLPLHVVRLQLPQLLGGRDHAGGDDRRRPGRGGRADRRADPQARRRVVEGHADVHHRAARDHLERRLRRRLPGADPTRRRRLQERGPKPARRDRRRLRRASRPASA